MILKVRSNESWNYIESKKFSILHLPRDNNVEYQADYKIGFGAIRDEERNDVEEEETLIYIETEEGTTYLISNAIGYLLNDKGQTVERL